MGDFETQNLVNAHGFFENFPHKWKDTWDNLLSSFYNNSMITVRMI